MKKINNFINEKLILNKNTKLKKLQGIDINNIEYDSLIDFLHIKSNPSHTTAHEMAIDYFNMWKISENIEKIQLCTDVETFNSVSFSKDIRNLINTSYEMNEYCQEQLSLNKTKRIMTNQRADIEIWKNDKIFCNITSKGTFYIVKETNE